MQTGEKQIKTRQNDLGQSAASAGGSENSLFISPCSLAGVAAAFQGVYCCNLLPWRRERGLLVVVVVGGSKLRHLGSNKRTDKVLFARC